MKKNFVKEVLLGALMLVFATSFVGCSDYDDEIDNLQKQIDKVSQDLTALQTSIGSLVKSITYDEATGNLTATKSDGTSSSIAIGKSVVKYTISIGEDGKITLTGDDGHTSSAQIPSGAVSFDPALLTVDATGAVVYDGVKTGVTIPRNAGGGTITEITDAEGNITGYTIAIGDKSATFSVVDAVPLKSITLIPDAVLNGKDAMKAVTVSYNAWTNTKSDKPASEWGEIWNAPAQVKPFDTNITPNVVAYYHLNPASVTEKQIKSLKYAFDDKDFIGQRAAKFNPEVVDFSVTDGILRVEIKPSGEFIQAIDSKKISLLALQATTVNGGEERVVTSAEYDAIYKTIITDLTLAHNSIGDPHHTHLYGADNAGTLIGKAEEAIRAEPQYEVAYKDDELDLKKLVETHYTEWADVENTSSQQTPIIRSVMNNVEDYGLAYKFTLSDYWSGSNQTNQSDFATLTDGVLKAKLFNTGIQDPEAAINRMPLVRVELVEKATGKNVANVGWIKVKIIKEKTPPQTWNKVFEDILWQCPDYTLRTTVEEMNVQIYQKVKLSKEEFHQLYKLKVQSDNVTAVNKNATDNGTVREIVNPDGNTETTILQWTMTPGEVRLDNDGKFAVTVTYAPIDPSRGDFDVTFTTNVIEPKANFSNKIQEYWYDNSTAIEINAVVPSNETTNNADIRTDIDNVFVLNAPVFALQPAVYQDATKAPDFTAANLTHSYFFKDENKGRKVTGNDGVEYTLNVVSDGRLLTAQRGATEQIVAYINPADGVTTYNNVKTVNNDPNYVLPERPWITDPTIVPAGISTNDTYAKALLNRAARGTAGVFYGVVGLQLQNRCNWVVTSDDKFNAKYLRPVNVSETPDKSFIDGVDGGSTINMLDLVVLSDWRNYAFKGRTTHDNKTYYQYYGVESITVDVPNITTNLNGGNLDTQKLTAVTDQIVISQDPKSDQVTPNYGTVTYTNNGTTVQDFKMKLPVNIEYLWGTVKAYIVVDVKKTVE